MAWAFFMAKSQRVWTRDIVGYWFSHYNGCHLVDYLLSGEDYILSQRDVQPFLCLRASGTGSLKDVAIMKQFEQLKKQVFSLNNTAENLKEILCVVGGLPTIDVNDNNFFPEKVRVMEVISAASQKLKEVAELVDTVSSNNVLVSKTDAAVLSSLKESYDAYRKDNDQLSEVLGELVKMQDLDGSGIDTYILHYVAYAMDSLRALLVLVKDIDYDCTNNG